MAQPLPPVAPLRTATVSAVAFLLTGCGATTLTGVDVPADLDECHLPCIDVALEKNGHPVSGEEIEILVDDRPWNPDQAHTTDDDGVFEACLQYTGLAPGDHDLTFRAGDASWSTSFTVHPFGWDVGRVREYGAPASLGYFHTYSPAPTPFFQAEPGSWYQIKLTSPYLWPDGTLVFGGRGEEIEGVYNQPYDVGMAHVDVETWTLLDVSEAPILPKIEGAWDYGDRNGPELTQDETGWTLWYHGRPEPDGDGFIGRAFSPDGVTWTPDPASPVVVGEEDLPDPCHPTLQEVDEGILELWYAAIGGLGFALSTDGGDSFELYCHNPVLRGPGDGTLKTPEVTWRDDRYLLSYGGGDKPEYHIGWAESYDGLHWLDSPTHAMDAREDTWTNLGVYAGQVLHWEDEPTLMFVGDGGGGGIGLAYADDVGGE